MTRGIEVACPHCGERMRVDPDTFGGPVSCTECSELFTANDATRVRGAAPPAKDARQAYELDARRGPAAGAQGAAVGAGWRCPRCNALLDAHDDACPFCGTTPGGEQGVLVGRDATRQARRRAMGRRETALSNAARIGALVLTLYWSLNALVCLALAAGGPVLSGVLGAMASLASAWFFYRALREECTFLEAVLGCVGAWVMMIGFALAPGIIYGSFGRSVLLGIFSACASLTVMLLALSLAWKPFK